MPDIYIVTTHGRLIRKNRAFNFRYPDGTISTFFPHNTEKIIMIGKIEISPDALKMMMHHNIEAVFMNLNGRFDGRLVFQEGKNILLRKRQFQKLDDQKFNLKICKSIVKGKIKNQISFMQRIKRERKKGDEFKRKLISIKAILTEVDKSETTDQVRGYEGSASRIYFSVFKENILPEWAIFNGRSMNPPGDNVNAVMSFIYTLMSYSVETAIMAEGLDTYAGFLHTPTYGRKSLIYDLMEEYRIPVCDTISCSLFNLGKISEDNFRKLDFSSDNDDAPYVPDDNEEASDETNVPGRKGVLLDREGLRICITAYESKLESGYYYNPTSSKISFRRIIHEQVKHFKRVINGDEEEYKPFLIK